MLRTRADILDLKKEHEGKLPSHSGLGGYPIFYLDGENNTLCADCANKEDEYSSPTVAADCHYEGPDMFCEGCGHIIESAYGDPWVEEDDSGCAMGNNCEDVPCRCTEEVKG
jgi:hypothetical protein